MNQPDSSFIFLFKFFIFDNVFLYENFDKFICYEIFLIFFMQFPLVWHSSKFI